MRALMRSRLFLLVVILGLLTVIFSVLWPITRAPGIYASCFVPDSIKYEGKIRGNIFLYVKNPTAKPLTISEVKLNDKPVGRIWKTDRSFLEPNVRDEYIAVTNENIAWYRVYPNPIQPRGIAGIILRLNPGVCTQNIANVTVTLANGRPPIGVKIAMQEPAFSLEYVGIGKNLDELHIYAKTQAGAKADISRVEIDGRPMAGQIHRVNSDYTYAKVKLPAPWQYGIFHVIAVGTDDELRAVMMRALPTPPPLGIFGNPGEGEIEQYRNHLFDVNIAFGPVGTNTYKCLANYGLKGAYMYFRTMKPGEKKCEPVFYNDLEQIAPIREQEALWAYFLEDEPDGRYHSTALPIGSIARDVERANQFCRIFDPLHPTYLQMDHGSYPLNMYIHGQIPDYICSHAYPLGGRIIEATLDHVNHTRAGSRPKPFYYLCWGNCSNAYREFEPDEMRMEAYSALAAGAKSLQWYPAHADVGLLKHPRMMRTVGEMNGILHQALPLLSIGMPVGEPEIEGNGHYLASSIICGDLAMVVILVNRDFQSTPEKFIRAPAEDVTVRVRLPSFMKTDGAARMRFPDTTAKIQAEIRGSVVTFHGTANPVGMWVIYSGKDVFDDLLQRQSAALARFKPMPDKKIAE